MTYKYLIAASVCCVLLVSSVFGQTGEVYSLNIVGFQKVASESSGLSMVSTPFERTPATLDDVLGDQLTAGKSQSQADQVIIWNATGAYYETYWLKNTDQKWYTAGALPELASNTYVSTEMGFWVRNRRDSNQIVVVSGDVVDDPVLTNYLIQGLTMVSYPFSTEVDINECGLTNGTAGKSQSVADQIIAWDANLQAYETYWLKNTDRKWYTGGALPEVATNVLVGAGRGFWYRNRGDSTFEWIEARPYTL